VTKATHKPIAGEGYRIAAFRCASKNTAHGPLEKEIGTVAESCLGRASYTICGKIAGIVRKEPGCGVYHDLFCMVREFGEPLHLKGEDEVAINYHSFIHLSSNRPGGKGKKRTLRAFRNYPFCWYSGGPSGEATRRMSGKEAAQHRPPRASITAARAANPREGRKGKEGGNVPRSFDSIR